MNIQEMLEARHKPFQVTVHPTTYTARHRAHELHVPARQVAKSVVLDGDGKYYLAVVAANETINMKRMRADLHCEHLRLLSEDRLSQLFPDCELGAIPPFGSEYGMTTVVDSALADNENIVFEGNSHNEAIRMRFEDYAEVEHPRYAEVAYHR